jgi:hypothetical protein
MAITFTLADLARFGCTGTHYAHWARSDMRWTEGVQFLTEHGAAWLIDKIVLSQSEPSIQRVPHQIWTFTLLTWSAGGVLTCESQGRQLIASYNIAFTDFTITPFELWVIDKVVLLPSEY